MNERRAHPRPGSSKAIRREQDARMVTYRFSFDFSPWATTELVIRCERDGELYASIERRTIKPDDR